MSSSLSSESRRQVLTRIMVHANTVKVAIPTTNGYYPAWTIKYNATIRGDNVTLDTCFEIIGSNDTLDTNLKSRMARLGNNHKVTLN